MTDTATRPELSQINETFAWETIAPLRGRRGRHSVPTINLGTRMASLSRAAMDLLGQPKFVHLLYDRERRVLGIRAAHEKDPTAYSVAGKAGSTRSFSAVTLLTVVGPGFAGQRYSVRLVGDTLVADLSQTYFREGSRDD